MEEGKSSDSSLTIMTSKKTGIILTTGAVFQSKGLFSHLDVKEMAILLTSLDEASESHKQCGYI